MSTFSRFKHDTSASDLLSHEPLSPELLYLYDEESTPSTVTSLSAFPGAGDSNAPPVGGKQAATEKTGLVQHHHVQQAGSGTANPLSTGFNIVNIYVGLGLLSMPYAMKEAGLIFIAVIVLCTALFTFSGRILVSTFKTLSPGTPLSYQSVGQVALGMFGRRLVDVLVFTEFIGAVAMMYVIAWNSILHIIHGGAAPSYTFSFWMVVLGTMVATIPTIWVENFARISVLSLLGLFSSLLVVGTVIGVSAKESSHGHDVELVNFSSMPIALGIYLVSLSGHATLPTLRASMKNPDRYFGLTLNVSFIVMCALYLTVGIAGYLRYGDSTLVLITSNLDTDVTTTFGFYLDKIVSGCVAASALTTISPAVHVLGEVPLNFFEAPGYLWRSFVKTMTLLLCLALAVGGFNYLASIESLLGGVCSLSTSLVLPPLFYFLIKRKELPVWKSVVLVATVVLALAMMLIILGANVYQLVSSGLGGGRSS